MSTAPSSRATPERSSTSAAAARERDTAGVDADEGERVEVGVPLDELVCDAESVRPSAGASSRTLATAGPVE